MNDKVCAMCIYFQEAAFGMGRCDAAESDLKNCGKPVSKAEVRADGDASKCEDFEMSARGVDLCAEYGIMAGSDFPGTLHAGADVPTRTVGVRS
jgi:hypothetical protein